MFKNKFLITLSFLLFSFLGNAQKIEFGVGAGVTHFKGDISPKFNPLQIGIGVNGLFRYNFSKSVSFRGQLMYGSYNAEDQKTNDVFYQSRNVIANGTLFEASVNAEYNFLNRIARTKSTEWTPYLFGGLGMTWVKNNSNNLSSLKITTPVIPYGVGVKYRFKGPFSVCAEFGSRYTFSDQLDQRFAFYGNTNPLSPDKKLYGDLSRKDQYFFTNLTLTYTIFKLVCPE
jgi:Domain of unknown function (DUF6089)